MGRLQLCIPRLRGWADYHRPRCKALSDQPQAGSRRCKNAGRAVTRFDEGSPVAAERVAGQRSSEISQNVAKTRVSSWTHKKLERFDEARAEQRKNNCSSKTEAARAQTRTEWDKEEDVQQQIDGGSLATPQTPEGDRFSARGRSEGYNGHRNQAGQ